jgi:hypothetical protein
VRLGRPAVALAVIALSLGAVGLLDLLVEPAEVVDPSPSVPAGVEATSGRAVCAVGDGREGTRAVIDVVRPGEAGDPPALSELRTFGNGADDVLLAARLFPGAGARVVAESDEGTAVDARWSGAPVTVSRSWRSSDAEDLPPGTATGPCTPGTSATSWTVPGLATAGGSEARLRIANPHATGATVAVGFLTPEGPDDPTRLRNVSVGPQETVELVLNDFLPEQPDLSVIVDVQSGRVAVEGVQFTRSAIGGIDGVSLLQAAAEPAEAWTVPLVIDGEGRASWLWIANDTDRSAPVELTLHTEDGGTVPEGLAEVSVPPNTVRRVDLRGTMPEGIRTAAVTARSSGVPVAVSATAQLSAASPEDTGFAVQLGAEADPVWTLAGIRREGRTEQLRLVNPGSEPATVDVTLWNGSNAVSPAELSGLEVPPGALRVVTFHELLEGAPSWALTVRASRGEVVAGGVGRGDPDGPEHFVAQVGAPSAWWRTVRAPILRSAPGTTQRLGTELGIEPIDPLAPADRPDTGDEGDRGPASDGDAPADEGDAPADDGGATTDDG